MKITESKDDNKPYTWGKPRGDLEPIEAWLFGRDTVPPAVPALRICVWPAPVLSLHGWPVLRFDAVLAELLDRMHEVMAKEEGIGLAANQVGVQSLVCIIDSPSGPVECINPRWRAEPKAKSVATREGCLSFPNVSEFVVRPEAGTVTYDDRQGARHELALSGIHAICAQHELDHLDGLTMLDRMSLLKRRLVLREYARRNAPTR